MAFQVKDGVDKHDIVMARLTKEIGQTLFDAWLHDISAEQVQDLLHGIADQVPVLHEEYESSAKATSFLDMMTGAKP